MLADGRTTHRKLLRDFAHRSLAIHQQADDQIPGWVGQWRQFRYKPDLRSLLILQTPNYLANNSKATVIAAMAASRKL